MHFKTREIKKEDKEDGSLDSNSSPDDKGDADQDDLGEDAVELMEIYKTKLAQVQAFYPGTRECKMALGKMTCSAMLSLDDITECRNNWRLLSAAELDLLSLGIIHSSLNCNETSIFSRVEENR